MKLILNSDVQSLGRKGDVVDVAKGYARNYLLPKKLAIVATANNLEFAQKLQEKRQEQAQINSELAESIMTALADAHIVISQTSTDEGTLYAAISNDQIVQAVETFSGYKLEETKASFKYSSSALVGAFTTAKISKLSVSRFRVVLFMRQIPVA